MKKYQRQYQAIREIAVWIKYRVVRAHAFIRFLQTVIQSFLKKTVYWTAVLVVGLGIAAITMHIGGVPVFHVVPSTSVVASNSIFLAQNDPGAKAEVEEYKQTEEYKESTKEATSAQSKSSTGIGTGITIVIGYLVYFIFVMVIGTINFILAYIFQMVVTYPYGGFWTLTGTSATGGFVNVSAVKTGWELVRDICNIFFSLILVIIALATVLKVEAYSWKKLIPKFVVAAILINFSKTICGIFTDFATVAMATFAGSFGDKFGVGMIGAFGLPGLGDLVTGNVSEEANKSATSSLLLAYIVAAAMQIITMIVLITFIVILIFRIVILWFLIVMSPLAYITRILPSTQKYSGQWWEMFGRYIVVGPLMTFFLWLTLSMLLGTSNTSKGTPMQAGFDTMTTEKAQAENPKYSPPKSGDFAAASPNVLANYLIAAVMMMASLKLVTGMANELGSVTSKIQGVARKAAFAAFAGGGVLMAKGGMALGKWGEKNLNSESADKKSWAPIARGLGSAMTVFGSTAFNPISSATNAAKLVASRYERAKKIHKAGVSDYAKDLMNRDVLGQDNKWKVAGVLGRAAGFANLATVDNADEIYDQLGGFRGIAQHQWKKYKAYKEGGTAQQLKDKEDALTQANKDSTDVHHRLTAEEAVDAERHNSQAVIAHQEMLENAQKINRGDNIAQMSVDMPPVRIVMENLKEQLQEDHKLALNSHNVTEAQDLERRINDLKHLLQPGSHATIDSDELIHVLGDKRGQEIKNNLEKGFTEEAKDIKKGGEDLRSKMVASGYQFDGVGNILPGGRGTNFVTINDSINEREDAANLVKKIEKEKNILQSELNAFEYGPGAWSRSAWNAAEADAGKKIEGVEGYQELSEYLQRALLRKDQGMVARVAKKLAQDGNLPGILQDFGFDNGPDGMKQFRKYIQEKSGMGEQRSLALFTDLAAISASKGNKGLLGAYVHEAGQWKEREPHLELENEQLEKLNRGVATVAELTAMNAKWGRMDATGQTKLYNQIMADRGAMRGLQNLILGKMSIGEMARMDKYGWGRDTASGKYELNESAKRQLQASSAEFADDRYWKQIPTEVKLTFSNNIDKLREAGVAADFLSKLEQWKYSVGQYQGVEPPRRRKVSNLV